jgi:hypothetical protein
MIGKVQAQISDKILEVKGKDLDARKVIGKYVRNITNTLLRILSWFRFRQHWGVPGHSLYIVLQHENGSRQLCRCGSKYNTTMADLYSPSYPDARYAVVVTI